MANKFEVGEIVYLKSGSPDLKVIAVDGDEIMVEWGQGKQREIFSAVCVQREAVSFGD